MTTRAPNEWGFWFPEDGETKDDVIPIIGRIHDAEHAAQEACEYDYSSRDGWERGEAEFKVAVISPDGEETTFTAWHEPAIHHRVSAA